MDKNSHRLKQMIISFSTYWEKKTHFQWNGEKMLFLMETTDENCMKIHQNHMIGSVFISICLNLLCGAKFPAANCVQLFFFFHSVEPIDWRIFSLGFFHYTHSNAPVDRSPFQSIVEFTACAGFLWTEDRERERERGRRNNCFASGFHMHIFWSKNTIHQPVSLCLLHMRFDWSLILFVCVVLLCWKILLFGPFNGIQFYILIAKSDKTMTIVRCV